MHLKTIIALVAAAPTTFIVELMSYVYQDWEFAKWICVAVIVDTATGIVKHWLKKDVSSDEFFHKFAKKIFIYICLLIMSNILQNYTVNGHLVGSTQWIAEYLCVFMMVREAISVLENANAIGPFFPAWILERLKDFNEKGEYVSQNDNQESE